MIKPGVLVAQPRVETSLVETNPKHVPAAHIEKHSSTEGVTQVSSLGRDRGVLRVTPVTKARYSHKLR